MKKIGVSKLMIEDDKAESDEDMEELENGKRSGGFGSQILNLKEK